jgi:hypothetical protein
LYNDFSNLWKKSWKMIAELLTRDGQAEENFSGETAS